MEGYVSQGHRVGHDGSHLACMHLCLYAPFALFLWGILMLTLCLIKVQLACRSDPTTLCLSPSGMKPMFRAQSSPCRTPAPARSRNAGGWAQVAVVPFLPTYILWPGLGL